jgi:cytochrome c2
MESNRSFLIAVILIGLGIMGIIATSWFDHHWSSLGGPSPVTGRMKEGMMGQNSMREMMHRMMPDYLPPGIETQDLPDPESEGASLLVQYCSECHNLPSPSMHSVGEWPVVAERMFYRMSRMSGTGMGMMIIEEPSPGEQQIIVAYLQNHSLKSISPESVPSPESEGAALFKDRCSQCHSLPDPSLHKADEWASTVKKMRTYIQTMRKKGVTDEEEKRIVGYLKTYAKQ